MFSENDLIFSGKTFPELYVEEVKRQVIGTLRHSTSRIPGRLGELHREARLGAKEIRVSVRIIADTRAEVMAKAHAVAAKLFTRRPAELITRGDHLRDMAVLAGDTDLDQLFETGAAELKFLNYSGLQHGPRVQQSVGAAPVTVLGTAETRGVFTVTLAAPASAVVLRSDTVDKEIRLTRLGGGSYPSGSVLVVDCEEEKVTQGGTLIMTDVDFLTTRFFDLLPGANTITCTGGSVTLAYTPRYF